MKLLMKELDGLLIKQYKIVEVNWEVEKELVQRYQVCGVPTLLLFNKGKLVQRYSGTLNAEEFLKEIVPEFQKAQFKKQTFD